MELKTMQYIKWIVIIVAFSIASVVKPMLQTDRQGVGHPAQQANLNTLPQQVIEEICKYVPSLKEVADLKRLCRSWEKAWDHQRVLEFTLRDIITMIPRGFAIPENAELGDIPKQALSAGIRILNKKLQGCCNDVELDLSGTGPLMTVNPRNHLTEADIKIISNLSNLRVLYLNDNNLTDLPSEISNLTNLRELYLDNNKFTQTALKCVSSLPALGVLYIGNNHLTEFPQEISKLRYHLKILAVIENQLTESAKLNIRQWLPDTEFLTDEALVEKFKAIF